MISPTTAVARVAQDIEAAFLAEMLKHTGLGESAGEFASFMREAEAREMVQCGGIGLTESLTTALEKRA